MAPEPRPVEADELERLREIARSSFTTSYSLSPGQIESVLETEFGEEHLERIREDDEAVLLVAEVDDVLAGVVQGTLSDGRGEVRWLHVDPERRGAGAGTALFEAAAEELRERGADAVYGATLSANAEGNMFFEKMGLVQVEEREVEIGGEEFVEHLFADESEVGEEAESEAAEHDEEEETPPDTVADEGREIFVGAEKDDRTTGTEAPFYRTYTDEERTEPYGLYCANCGSTDVEMSDMEQVKCGECGNSRRADEEYDASYL